MREVVEVDLVGIEFDEFAQPNRLKPTTLYVVVDGVDVNAKHFGQLVPREQKNSAFHLIGN